MASAAFLLAINFTIGIGFAVAFLALGWRTGIKLGLWCAAGFATVSITALAEAFAFAIPSVRLASTLSFSTLMFGLALIIAGLSRHYRPQQRVGWLFVFAGLASAFNTFVLVNLPRATMLHALGYQLPFAVITAFAAAIVFAAPRRRMSETALAVILAASAIQFLAKAIIVGYVGGRDPGLRNGLVGLYAYFSQTAAGILSILFGLALLFVIGRAVMANTARRFQRDGLSGALTRSAFLEEAAAALKATPRGLPSSLIMCDLDHFKTINDRYGHAAGDEVIRVFGASLGDRTQGNGICGRIGGEEFCVLMPECSIAAARVYLDAVRGLSAMTIYPLLPPDFRVTASFGIAVTDCDEPIESAMRRADIALYEAKAAGRDAYRFAAARGAVESVTAGAA